MGEQRFGPWKAVIQEPGKHYVIYPNGDAELGNWMVAKDIEWETWANLIAAAPDLAHELGKLLEAIDAGQLEMNSPELDGDPESGIPPHPWHEEWLYYARRAHARATPEETTDG